MLVEVDPWYECIYMGMNTILGDPFATADYCRIKCGDGLNHRLEACDDGNTWDGLPQPIPL